ncbi:MAG: M20/M25/M40 family metallo-hydrolase [Verrucomicrobia bacterium]|nr:M20/M25/M40 family metallo-hydrolase [Verrucomicrobiota bacterium]
MKNKNEALKRDVIAFTQQLASTPSVTMDEAKAAGLVEAKMREIGYDKVFRDDVGNVVGVMIGREADPTVLLNSHLDTVSSSETNPVRLEDGKLFGTGTADCKGGLAAHVFAGALLRRSLLPLRGNLVVAATVAEENGRSAGVRALMERTLPALGMKPTFAILGEPTGLGLYYGHDGWMEMDVTVEGANPYHVDDAAKAIFSDLGAGENGNTPQLENMFIHKPRFETVGGFRRATIPVTRRLGFGEDAGHVVSQFKHDAVLVAQTSGTVAVEVAVRKETRRLYNGQATTVHHVTHAWAIDPFHSLMSRARQSLAAAGCEVRPGKWQLGRLGMGTAGSVLVKEFDVPTVGYGPGLEAQAHAHGEFVETAKITEAVYGTTAMVHGLIGIPVCGWTSDEI